MGRFVLRIVPLLAALLGCSAGERNGRPEGDAKYQEIATLPVGLEVTHTPNPAPASRRGPSGMEYSWVYRTSVRAVGEPVTITEFGAFAWQEGRWVLANYTGAPFTAADFADWYSCPEAKVLPGQAYADPDNWSGGSSLARDKSLWYFIGVTSSGKRVKGEAVVDHLDKLEE